VTYFAAEASFDEEERYPQIVHPPLTVLQDTATQRQHKENATYPLYIIVHTTTSVEYINTYASTYERRVHKFMYAILY